MCRLLNNEANILNNLPEYKKRGKNQMTELQRSKTKWFERRTRMGPRRITTNPKILNKVLDWLLKRKSICAALTIQPTLNTRNRCYALNPLDTRPDIIEDYGVHCSRSDNDENNFTNYNTNEDVGERYLLNKVAFQCPHSLPSYNEFSGFDSSDNECLTCSLKSGY